MFVGAGDGTPRGVLKSVVAALKSAERIHVRPSHFAALAVIPRDLRADDGNAVLVCGGVASSDFDRTPRGGGVPRARCGVVRVHVAKIRQPLAYARKKSPFLKFF